MQTPLLDKVWQTLILIPGGIDSPRYNFLRGKVYPFIQSLEHGNLITWYCILRHGPTNAGYPDKENGRIYYHLRICIDNDDNVDLIKDNIPNDFIILDIGLEGEKIWRDNAIVSDPIVGFDPTSLKENCQGELWKLIGENSEMVLKLLMLHPDGIDIPLQHFGQFSHYIFNLMGNIEREVNVECPCCHSTFPIWV